MNNLTTPGRYSVPGSSYWDSISNKPANWAGSAGIIVVEQGSASGWRVQKIYAQDYSVVWIRHIYISDHQYDKPWQRLDNFGCNTPEALASLLGVFTNGGGISNIDTLFDQGYYTSWSDNFGFNIVLVYKTAEGKTLQFYISAMETKYRYSMDNSTWQSWNVLSYPFELRNYTTLSSLANALGVLKAYGDSDFNGDLNSIRGNYYLRVEPSATNNPTGDYAQLISIGGSIGNSRFGVFQICFQYQINSDIYVRAYSDDIWNAWKKITLTSIS